MSDYKILVVDDEKPARKMLIDMVNCQDSGFIVCGEAKNGEEAYRMYLELQPDIIITDIQMPIMSGLDLIKKVRETDSEQRFIILSCYEEFSYAREAVRMNIEDYLIKDLIKKEDILQILFSIVEKKNEYLKENPKENKNIQVKNNPKLIKCITNYKDKDIDKYLHLEDDCLYGILIISIDDYYSNQINYLKYNKEKIKENLVSTLELFNIEFNQPVIHDFSYIGNGKFIVIIKKENELSENNRLKNSINISSNIRLGFSRRDYEHTLSISISRDFKGADSFKERYDEANEMLKYRLFLGKNKNITYNYSLSKLTKMSDQSLKNKIDRINKSIQDLDIEIMKKEIIGLYNENLRGFMQYNFLKEVNGQLFYILSDICHQNNIKYSDLFEVNYIPYQMVNKFDTVKEISDWFIKYFSEIIQIIEERNKYSRHINDAILYIKENYKEAISLNEISEVLNIHSVYLSRKFKEETGITVSKYILDYRMELAKQLIETTNMKLYEIAEQVGYRNPQHFVVAFKKNEGITPKKYRETIK